MVTEFFATVDVADVHLHDGGIECDQSVAQRNGGVRVPTGIDDDARNVSPGLVDPIDQLASWFDCFASTTTPNFAAAASQRETTSSRVPLP